MKNVVMSELPIEILVLAKELTDEAYILGIQQGILFFLKKESNSYIFREWEATSGHSGHFSTKEEAIERFFKHGLLYNYKTNVYCFDHMLELTDFIKNL